MLLRRWIGLLAVLGVLLHAGAVLRHHAVMVDAELQHQGLLADLHQICKAGGTGSVDTASLPDVPRPSNSQNGCPICSGLATAFALPTPEAAPLPVLFEAPVRRPIAVAAIIGQTPAKLPPARGPPSHT
jgi:hypothetical protein